MPSQIQFRRDTAANWTSCDPTLKSGELGYVTDTNQFKIGDGATAWSTLTYYPYIPIDVSNAASGQQLTFNGSAWINADPTGELSTALDNPTSGQQLTFNSELSAWVNADPTGELSTALDNPTSGQHLVFDGSDWANADAEAGVTLIDGGDFTTGSTTVSTQNNNFDAGAFT